MDRTKVVQTQQVTQWWAILLRVLKAIGVILVAITSLVIALKSAGIIGAPYPTEPFAQPVNAVSSGNSSPLIHGHDNTIQNATIVQGSNNAIVLPPADKQAANDLAKLLSGTWKGTSTSVVPSGEMISTGYTRLLETGAYSHSGELLFHIKIKDQPCEIQFTTAATGSWNVISDKYVVTTSDVKSKARALKCLGQPDLILDNPRTIPASLLPNLEEMTPRGFSQEYKIVELTKSTLHLEGTDIRGVAIHYVAARELQ